MKVKTHPIEKLPAPLSEPIKKTASELAEVKSPMVVVAFRNHHSAVKNRLIALRRALSDNQINQSQPTSTKVWPEQDLDFVVCPETRESERFSSPEKNAHN